MEPNASAGEPRPLIVMIDDDPETLRSLKRLLHAEPYELLSTDDPAQVLRWICERSVDLILADQRMPGMSGTDLIDVVQDYSPATTCVILSGYPDAALVIEQTGLKLELVRKPWDNDGLRAMIRRLLQERARTARPDSPVPEETKARETRIDCAGQSAETVISRILSVCVKAQDEGKRPIIVLENTRLLMDSVSRLLKGLARSVALLHLPIDLRDESGCVTAFLGAMTARHTVPPA
jgi:response regulator RpfG family c-di-GMP phosphodiesterase